MNVGWIVTLATGSVSGETVILLRSTALKAFLVCLLSAILLPFFDDELYNQISAFSG